MNKTPVTPIQNPCPHKKTDPFTDIPAALLNSADIKLYVQATDMVSPFYDDDLKSASYAVRMKGICKWWDEDGTEHEINLDGKEHAYFTLAPNTIAFVELEPLISLPDYIAVRFNLKITNVYRGLLMGTGPLIDPGFEGKIYVPLHNLTAQAYKFEFNDALVWLEFTKTSPLPDQMPPIDVPSIERGEYKPFPEEKKNLVLKDYLNQASKGDPIISSIPSEKGKTRKYLKDIENMVKWTNRIGWVAGFALIIGVVSLVYTNWQTQRTLSDKLQSTEISTLKKVRALEISISDSHTRDAKISASSVAVLQQENLDLKEDISALKQCVRLLIEKKDHESSEKLCAL